MTPEVQADLDQLTGLEAAIEAALYASITAWLDRVRAAVLPALTAATEPTPPPPPEEEGEGIPPDVAALIVAGAVLWQTEIDGVFLPTFAGLLGDLATREAARADEEPGMRQIRVDVTTDDRGQGGTEHDQIQEWIGQHTAQVRERLLGAPAAAERAVRVAVERAGPDVAAQRRAAREALDPASDGWRGFARRVARNEAAAGFNGIRVAAARIRERARAAWDRFRRRNNEPDDRDDFRLMKRWVCVTGDTRIRAVGVSHIARRHHEGTVIRIATASGAVITTTPEHRVLTGRGWIPAENLEIGDRLVHIAGGNSTGAPDVEHLPPRIDEVFHAAMSAMPVEMRAVSVRVDLDVDVVDGQIEVVSPDRDLAAHLIPGFGQLGVDEGLASADVLAERLLLAGGDPRGVPGGLLTADVGCARCSDAVAGGLGVAGGTELSGVAVSTELHTGVGEDASNPRAAGIERGGDRLDGFACGVPRHDGFGEGSALLAAPRGCHRAGCVCGAGHPGALRPASGDAVGAQQPGYRSTGSAGLPGDFGAAPPLVVEPDDVVSIEVETFSGHVYDLTTSSGWFDANHLVIHNCQHDDRVRHTHEEADGQRVGLDEDFEVGGATLRFPGDPLGPIDETAGCRCFVVVDRARAQTAAATPAGGSRIMKTFRAQIIPIGVFGRTQGWMLSAGVQIVDTVLPMAMKWQRTADPGHDGAYTVGAIEELVIEDGWLVGVGTMLDSPEAVEALQQLEAGVTRPSVELVGRTEVMVDDTGTEITMEQAEARYAAGQMIGMRIDVAEVVAATLVSVPEFRDATMTFADAEADRLAPAIVAAAQIIEDRYDPALFADPQLGEPVPIHLTSDGRVVGYLATWDAVHRGRGVKPYHSKSGYAEFHQSSVLLESGERLRVGRLTVGGGHAKAGVGMRAAVEHYDNVGTCWALVRAGEDSIGIWVAGVVHPSASPDQVRLALGTPHSGHWEPVGGHPELIAACAVNTPAFAVLSRDRDGGLAMVASFAPRWSQPPGGSNRMLVDIADLAADRALERFDARREATARQAQAQQLIGEHRRRTLGEIIRANHTARGIGA